MVVPGDLDADGEQRLRDNAKDITRRTVQDQLLKLKYVAAHMVKPVGLVSQHLAYVQSAPHANHTAQDAHLGRYP